MISKEYVNNVFVNCPFDPSYKDLFNALIFAVHDCGFLARCALEEEDSSENRLSKIKTIIYESKYGIHDISRTEIDGKNSLPRFNMPLELGLFLGCRYYGDEIHANKKCLILDKEPYRYQKFISDISGQDIKSHSNEIYDVIRVVRDWLFNVSKRTTIPTYRIIKERFSLFYEEYPKILEDIGLNKHNIQFIDYANIVTEWLQRQ